MMNMKRDTLLSLVDEFGEINPGTWSYLKRNEFNADYLAIVQSMYGPEIKVLKERTDLEEWIKEKEELEPFTGDIDEIPDNINGEPLFLYDLDEAIGILEQEKERVRNQKGIETTPGIKP